MNRFVLIGLLLSLTLSTSAEQRTQPASVDARIRAVPYQAYQVVHLPTRIGVVTHLRFADQESILTHVMGDAQAYSVMTYHNHLFLKPKVADPDSNLVVITNQRAYHFSLTLDKQSNSPGVHALVFQYPKQQQVSALKNNVSTVFPRTATHYSVAYQMSGDKVLAPWHVWDDGVFTYFQFHSHAELPALYAVQTDGQESLVNTTLQGDTLIAHALKARWVLRLGKQALAIHNRALMASPSTGSGTRSNQVQRLIKGGAR